MADKNDDMQAAELAAAQNAAMIFNTLLTPPKPPEKERDKVKEPPHHTRSREREER